MPQNNLSMSRSTEELPSEQIQVKDPLGFFGYSVHRLLRRPTAILSLGIILIIIVAAAGAPVFATHPPAKMDLKERLAGPSTRHLMGTDESGRDLFSRMLYGARFSVLVASLSPLISLVFGATFGLLAGWKGGRTDDIVMRILDGFLAIPPILFALALLSMLGPSFVNVVIAVGVLGVPLTARITRATVMGEKQRDYVLASRSIGATDNYLMWRVLLPNSMGPLIVVVSLLAANAILLEAALSFLGLGIQPPQASWGVLLQLGYGYMSHNSWYVIFPGLGIFVLVWALNMMGDALRDELDPRLRGGV